MRISISPFHNNEKQEINPSEFPGFSHATYFNWFCFKNLIKVENISGFFIGNWYARLFIPSIIVSFIIGGYFIGYFAIFPLFPSVETLMKIIQLIIGGLFLSTYLLTIFVGPGYYPFYWYIQKHHNFNQDETTQEIPEYSPYDSPPEGIISSISQLEWARSQPRPPRSIVSKSAKRIIIRPDHYCGISEVFIGKRNIKFFLLYTFYGCIYCGIFAIFIAIQIKRLFSIKPFKITIPFLIWCVLIYTASHFSLFSGCFFIESFSVALTGKTIWEVNNKIPEQKLPKGSTIEYLEDIFGPRQYFYTWLLPTSPWKHYTNDELVKNYVSYYD